MFWQHGSTLEYVHKQVNDILCYECRYTSHYGQKCRLCSVNKVTFSQNERSEGGISVNKQK